MSALSTNHGTSTLDLRLADLGADCEHHSCEGCGRPQLGTARCSCPEDQPRVGRLHTSLADVVDVVDVGWGALQTEGLDTDPTDRLSCRAYALA